MTSDSEQMAVVPSFSVGAEQIVPRLTCTAVTVLIMSKSSISFFLVPLPFVGSC